MASRLPIDSGLVVQTVTGIGKDDRIIRLNAQAANGCDHVVHGDAITRENLYGQLLRCDIRREN